ncbi:MAG: hypothetical protein L0213_02965 [Candidatus Dadabacteria bacterium]|nr:hypothetical protein [Candidatus Dadabacteria bacterium]
MRNTIVTVFGSLFLLFVMSGVFADSARAGENGVACSLEIAKDTSETGRPTGFTILVDPSGGDEFELLVADGQPDGFGLHFGESAIVTEIVPEGWRLVDVSCESGPGVSIIIDEENNVLINCLTVGEGLCTFTNVQTENIPTLGEWGMIAAAAGLVLVGVWFVLRRRRAQTV